MLFTSAVGDSRSVIIDQLLRLLLFRFRLTSFQIRGSCEPRVYYQVQLNLVQSVTTYLEKLTMTLADDWGKSLRETCAESFFEPSVKGKPTKAAQAKHTPAPPPVVKKPAVIRSKWEGEDEEESDPVVSRSLIQSVILRNDSCIRATGRNLLKKSLRRRRFMRLFHLRRRKGP